MFILGVIVGNEHNVGLLFRDKSGCQKCCKNNWKTSLKRSQIFFLKENTLKQSKRQDALIIELFYASNTKEFWKIREKMCFKF